ncbi:MAG TPA: hypothetical protein VFV41_00315 [Streptosporangiaceae bacterium]|nr:hypothetical protein [Streptosporangiaceae bacterium]
MSRGGWREAGPEVVIAVLAVIALSATALAFAGAAAAALVFAGACAAAVAAIRGFTPEGEVPGTEPDESPLRAGQTSLLRFWRRRAGVEAAIQTMTGYDLELRGTLQHLLAARLAERHGISLYDDPGEARRLLAAAGGDRLWYWLDPARPAVTDQGRSAGIPPRTLAAIIDRLERL